MSTLSQSEYFILSRVDGLSSVADILAISPIGEDETLRCIYGLVSAGVLEFQGGSPSRDESLAPTASDAAEDPRFPRARLRPNRRRQESRSRGRT